MKTFVVISIEACGNNVLAGQVAAARRDVAVKPRRAKM
jgi:hypothetical protein